MSFNDPFTIDSTGLTTGGSPSVKASVDKIAAAIVASRDKPSAFALAQTFAEVVEKLRAFGA